MGQEHVWYQCSDGTCDRPWCARCDGSLGSCTVCGGAESTLLPTCPGYALTDAALDAVQAGTLKAVEDLKPEHRRSP